MRRALVLALSAALLVAGCSSSKSVGNDATTETPAAPTDISVGTTDVTTTTLVGTNNTTTSSAPTTTTEPAAVPLTLRSDGVGAFLLGDAATTVVAGLTSELGAPATDAVTEYPTAEGLGQYTTTDGEAGFVAPVGRSVCWNNEFCAEFGGVTGASMSFTGWSYRGTAATVLYSTSGATIGTRWSDLPAITVDEGGCYSVGSGQIDGIRLTLESSGEPFGSFDESGNYISNLPPPEQVTVIWMEAGEVPIFLYGDC